MFNRKGLLWKFILGTVSTSAANGVFYDVLTVPMTLDGDTTTVSARSLIGPVTEGARVAVIYVPPTGYYIVGYVNNPGAGYVRSQAGIKAFTFTTVSSASIAITFNNPFSTAPSVTATINSSSGTANLWFVRAINVTTTGFTLLVSAAAANSWAGVPVSWHAMEPTQ
jgi:hypothetical protein